MDGYAILNHIDSAFKAGLATKALQQRIGEVKRGDHVVPVFLNDQGQVVVLQPAIEALDRLDGGPGPTRRTGTSTHHEIETYVAYANRFKQEASLVWADQGSFRVTTVLDYHPPGGDPTAAGRCEHRAIYTCPRSPQWKEWTALDGKEQKQEAFADFLEAHFEDLTSDDGYPAPTDLVKLARDLQVHTVGSFKRQINPTTGEGILLCKTENEASSTPIPRAFIAGLPVFEGGVAYRVECRIRFRMAGEGANVPLFMFTMYRRAEIERDAFLAVRKQVAEQTGLAVFAGSPET